MSFLIGCHLSSSKGFVAMYQTMVELGGNTFQYFSRNPRGSAKKVFDEADARRFTELMRGDQLASVICHAPYTYNPASAKDHVREFARMAMAEDLEDLKYFDDVLYNFHPGSHVGQGEDKGIELIIELLNDIITDETPGTLLLEGMSGKGSEIGYRFEHLRDIIQGVKRQEIMGVCLDTCHLHEAGYDIVNDLDGVLAEFDRIVGLDRLKAIHLNDSKNKLGAKKDRHEKIGQGELGLDTFSLVINHPKLKHLPFALETPNELPGYAEEIALLKSLRIDE
ncbi:MAG TPA: deoxyribonuclease IV [Tissierellia bacterium]|nr:deoxyribonuclease IV [Tissierellia bacterium]